MKIIGQFIICISFVTSAISIDDKPEKHETALMLAIKTGCIDTIRELIDIGADVNAITERSPSNAGKPVLRYAIDSKSLHAIRMLINAGANCNEMTESPIVYHRKEAQVRNLPLLSHAINTNAPIKIIALLIFHADINKQSDGKGWTPLMIAAYRGNKEAVERLLAAGANKAIKNDADGGRTAVDYAQENNNQAIINLLKKSSGQLKVYYKQRSFG